MRYPPKSDGRRDTATARRRTASPGPVHRPGCTQNHRRSIDEVAYGRREAFTALSMQKASIDEIVRATSGNAGHTVVLEDLNHQVRSPSTAAMFPAADLLVDWSRRSRLDSEEHWTACKVGPFREMGPLDLPGAGAAGSRTSLTLGAQHRHWP